MAEDRPKKTIQEDAHETLVRSLESIKELLLQSESKISAAKESIARAGMSGHRRPAADPAPAPEPPAPGDEDAVPVLEDVVVPAPGTGAGQEQPLEDNPAMPPPAAAPEELAETIEDFRAALEKEIHDTLIHGIVQLEADIKEHIRKALDDFAARLGLNRDPD